MRSVFWLDAIANGLHQDRGDKGRVIENATSPGKSIRTLVLPVERTQPAAAAERVRLRVPLTEGRGTCAQSSAESPQEKQHTTHLSSKDKNARSSASCLVARIPVYYDHRGRVLLALCHRLAPPWPQHSSLLLWAISRRPVIRSPYHPSTLHLLPNRSKSPRSTAITLPSTPPTHRSSTGGHGLTIF